MQPLSKSLLPRLSASALRARRRIIATQMFAPTNSCSCYLGIASANLPKLSHPSLLVITVTKLFASVRQSVTTPRALQRAPKCFCQEEHFLRELQLGGTHGVSASYEIMRCPRTIHTAAFFTSRRKDATSFRVIAIFADQIGEPYRTTESTTALFFGIRQLSPAITAFYLKIRRTKCSLKSQFPFRMSSKYLMWDPIRTGVSETFKVISGDRLAELT
ncbi:hypothetical protein KM043_016618 [Ampulex compressa]|nr:hypothetical protein KM043_016618 [Ampulex compressa]